MTDKVQKIREEVERLKEETSIGLSEHENGVEQGRMEIINALSLFIDSLQEEPVSEELEEATNAYISNEINYSHSRSDTFKAGAEWQKDKFEENRLAAYERQTEKEADIERDFVMSIIDNEHRQPTFDDAIKYGMTLQKEQMMKEAVESKVTITSKGILLEDLRIEDFDYEDKVKLMVIKED